MKIRILVSACLIGQPVRYDGSAATVPSAVLDRWSREERLVSFCPEVAGGFPVPRPPAEIAGDGGSAVLRGEAKVFDESGRDVTTYFVDGAHEALRVAQNQGVRLAILKDNSPSCGSSLIHDGGFTGTLIPGTGVTTALLENHGIRVFSEQRIEEAEDYLKRLESGSWCSSH